MSLKSDLLLLISPPQNVSFFSGSLVYVTFNLFALERKISYFSLIVAFPALLKVQLKLSFGHPYNTMAE